MNMTDIHENARRCIELHGDKAEAVARRKAQECHEAGKQDEARNWERVTAAIREKRAVHFS
jgi:hypothetical protein